MYLTHGLMCKEHTKKYHCIDNNTLALHTTTPLPCGAQPNGLAPPGLTRRAAIVTRPDCFELFDKMSPQGMHKEEGEVREAIAGFCTFAIWQDKYGCDVAVRQIKEKKENKSAVPALQQLSSTLSAIGRHKETTKQRQRRATQGTSKNNSCAYLRSVGSRLNESYGYFLFGNSIRGTTSF